MNATDIRFFRAFLLDQRSSVLNKSSEFRTEQSSEREHILDEAEIASQNLNMSLSIQMHERDRLLLYQINKALAKMEDGSFGSCESCGESIGVSRLKARPFASLCIQCKEEQEDPRNYIN